MSQSSMMLDEIVLSWGASLVVDVDAGLSDWIRDQSGLLLPRNLLSQSSTVFFDDKLDTVMRQGCFPKGCVLSLVSSCAIAC